MRIAVQLNQLTPEQAYAAGFRQGRYERIGNWAWRVTMLILALWGGTTLVSNFGMFLLACMGIPVDTVETSWK